MAKSKKSKDKGTDTHGSKDVTAALKNLNKQGLSGVEATEGSFGEIPDAKYQVRIDSCKIERAQNGEGRLQVTTELTIVGPSCQNRKMWKRDGIEDETGIGYFKSGFLRIGLELSEDATDWPEQLLEVEKSFAEVTVRNKGDFINVYFNKALDDDAVDVADLEEEAGDDNWSEGDRVLVEFDGEDFAGEITDLGDDTATVTFDDESVEEVDIADLREEESEDGDEEEEDGEDDEAEEEDEEEDEESDEGEGDEEEEEEAEEGEEEEEGGPVGNFTKTSEAQNKKIQKLATQHDFNEEDYEDWKDLLMDIAEYLEIEGEYSTCAKLLKACEAVGDDDDD